MGALASLKQRLAPVAGLQSWDSQESGKEGY